MFAGATVDLGTMCRLVIAGVDVLVSSRPDQTWDAEPFLLHGIDVTQRKIVAIKGANHFRAGFRDIASSIVTVDSEGLSSAEVSYFARTKLASEVEVVLA
ncbi:MAG: MlrC C-terminal domain-containing protein [Xenophilus sp.]